MFAHCPGVLALIEFEEDGLALMQEIDTETGLFSYCCDENRKCYKISDAGVELQPWRERPVFRKRWQRNVQRKARWAARDQALLAQVSKPTVIPNGRAPLFFRNKRYIYAKPSMQFPFRYTLRSPKRSENLPLVIYLPGAKAEGTMGFAPLFQRYSLMFMRRVQRQKYHLLVPQQGLCDVYSDEVSEALGEVIAALPRVDRSRIYLTGVSMGGCWAIIECHRHPERYAAAVAAVAWLQNLDDPNHVNPFCRPLDNTAYDALTKTPMWLAYCQLEHERNSALHDELHTRGADVRQSYLRLRGWFGHCVAPFVFSLTKPWATWLFKQQNKISS